MSRDSKRSLTLIKSGSTNLDLVSKEFKSPQLKEIACEIIGVIGLVKAGKINYEEARIRITGCKHLIQLIALEKFERNN